MKETFTLFTVKYLDAVRDEHFFTAYAKDKKELKDIFIKEYPECKLIKIVKK